MEAKTDGRYLKREEIARRKNETARRIGKIGKKDIKAQKIKIIRIG